MEASIHKHTDEDFRIEMSKHSLGIAERTFYTVNIYIGKNRFTMFFPEDDFRLIQKHFDNYEYTDYSKEED